MKTNLLNLWDRLRSGYWFVPAVMTLFTALLAVGMVELDRHISVGLPDSLWLYNSVPDAARNLVGTLAASIMTVGGVVFSITIVALTLASNQFGPYVLENYFRDRTSQATLGTVVATFLYCILVLQVISERENAHFVPRLSIMVAMLLTLISLMLLVYFIHHVSHSIHAGNLIAQMGRQLTLAINSFYKNDPPTPDDLPIHIVEATTQHGRIVTSNMAGYVQSLDTDTLIKLAEENDIVIRILCRPGDFMVAEGPMIQIYPPREVDEKLTATICECIVLGKRRTPVQDLEFSISQMVQIALRALSPAMNDAFTAITCVDYLAAAMARLAHFPDPCPYRMCNHQLRVILRVPTYDGWLQAAFNQIRQAARNNTAVSIRLMEVLAQIARQTTRREQQQTLMDQAQMVLASRHALHEASDRDDLQKRYQKFLAAMRHDEAKILS